MQRMNTGSYSQLIPPARLVDIRPIAPGGGVTGSTPRPNANQWAFQELGCGLFIHFGMNTFTGEGTGGKGAHPAETFHPTDLNCDDWLRVAADLGATYAVLTARHEEGFCLWPTATTPYSVASSAWRGGQGDVVAEFVAACRRAGIKPCFYHSSFMDARHVFKSGDPIKWHQEWFATTNKRLSEPGELERFQAMQVAQIRELLTNYGDIAYLWLDHIGETQGILEPVLVEQFWLAIVEEARRIQPACLLLKADVYLTHDPDVHGGFHGGRACYPLWHASRRVNTAEGQGDPSMDPLHGDQYIVWESNTVFSGGWFWDGGPVKELAEMKGHYYATIGRGSTFLPNFAPDRSGRMPDLVHERARAFGAWVRATFGQPLATISTATITANGEIVTLQLPRPALVDHVILQEDLREGQRISFFVIESATADGWTTVVEGQSVGHTRIIRLEQAIEVTALRWRCIATLGNQPILRSFSVFTPRDEK